MDNTHKGIRVYVPSVDRIMTPGEEKFYSPREDLETLSENMQSLDASINVLDTDINALSSKYVTPENIANVITGYAQLFVMAYLGASDSATGFTGTDGITFDGTNFYGYDGTDIIKWKPGGTQTVFVAAPPKNVRSFAWDKNNNWLYAGENDEDSYGSEDASRLLTYDSDGVLLYNVAISNPVMPPLEENILGLGYDYDNSKLYVLYYGPTYDIVRYGVVDPTTGTITEQVDINELYASGLDMCYSDGILHILMADHVVGFRVGNAVPIYRSGLPTTAPVGYFTFDEATKIFCFADGSTSTIGYNGLSHVQRSRIEAFASTADLDTLETTLNALETLLQGTAKVKLWDGTHEVDVQADGSLAATIVAGSDIETTLTNLEKATAAIATDRLLMQGKDAAGNLMPSMDAIARKGFVAVTDGTNTLNPCHFGTLSAKAVNGVLAHGMRSHDESARPLGVHAWSDSLIHKSTYTLSVTSYTGGKEEGAKIHTNDACFVVSYEANAVEAKTGYVLIDLSNTTNYPHTLSSEIHVDWLAFSMLGDVSCEGHVHIGFISAIDADKGTMISFVCKPADKIARASFVSRQYNPSAVRCKVAGVLAGGGMKIVDDTTFQTDVELAGTYAAVIPAVGDLVMLISRVAGTFETVSVAIGYHTI